MKVFSVHTFAKRSSRKIAAALVTTSLLIPSLQAQSQSAPAIETIEDYNAQLIANGVAWAGSSYLPSLYTGFAPREEEANRIHFHLSRGNVARLTVTLDEQAILTYLYSLQKRRAVINTVVTGGDIKPVHRPQNAMHDALLDSPKIGVSQTISDFEAGRISREEFYARSLAIMKALNPGRVFEINLDLKAVSAQWRSKMLSIVKKSASAQSEEQMVSYLTKNSKEALILANQILFGRINATQLTAAQIQALAKLALSTADEEAFANDVVALVKSLSGNRFDFKIVKGGKSQPAINGTQLSVTEFTAVYPVGSVLATVKDSSGNRIPMIRETGAMNFIATDRFDVDQIRGEPYYGWIPKMNYTLSQNAIHNPAVRTSLSKPAFSFLHKELGVPASERTIWLVSRSPVSHGCTRMAAGHIHEVRAIFPSNPQEMTRVVYTGNSSADYDLFDVDGSGQLKVMGSKYFVAYNLVSTGSDAGYRESKGLIAESFKRDEFYGQLYGANQFTKVQDRFVFSNPSITYFSGPVGRDVRAKAFSVKIAGDYPLYEQNYEQDKIQFFDLPKLGLKSLGGTTQASRLVRLFGRINACGPFAAEFAKCRESEFTKEMTSLIGTR
jgi:hypothetical protein